MDSFLQAIGWRRNTTERSIPLLQFRAWQTWVVLAIALVIAVALARLL